MYYFKINSSASPKVLYPVTITLSPACNPPVISYCCGFCRPMLMFTLRAFCPGLVQLIDPLAAGRLEEVAARDDQRLFGLSQFNLYAKALSDADILG